MSKRTTPRTLKKEIEDLKSSSEKMIEVKNESNKISEYELMRESNIARNKEYMESLGLSADIKSTTIKPQPSQRGLKRPKTERRKSDSEVGIRRKSERVQGISPKPLEETSLKIIDKHLDDHYSFQQKMMKKITIRLDENDDENNNEEISEFMKILNDNIVEPSSFSNIKSQNISSEKYSQKMNKLKIDENHVAKVTSDRAYSITVLPSTSDVIAFVGDRSGNLGIWNYSNQHLDEVNNGVQQFQPHSATINALSFAAQSPSKLYSTSYDNTVRCFDLGAQTFNLVYSATESEGWLQHSTLTADGRAMLIGDSVGRVTSLDLRTPKIAWQAYCCDKKVQTVSVNPMQEHYLATASLDKTVRIFDLRKLPSSSSTCLSSSFGSSPRDQKNKKVKRESVDINTDDDTPHVIYSNPQFEGPEFGALSTLTDSNSFNCAYWNPTGTTIVTVSQSNFIRLLHNPQHIHGDQGVGSASACSFRHNNQTGRYLPVFHAAWDPKHPNAFILGSMEQPRKVQIFEFFCNEELKTKTNDITCSQVAKLEDQGCYLASVQSRNVFHPYLDVVLCANSSGKVHIFD